MRFVSIIVGLIISMPSAAYAVESGVDYDSLTQKVRKSVYVYHHKRGISLNGSETKSLLVQSFLGQLVKSPLAELEAHLLYACGMPDLYDAESINFSLGEGVQVNRSDIFLYARKYDSRNRFPAKEGMSSKKRRKLDAKSMKYFNDHWKRNKFLPQTATEELGEINPWVSDESLVADMREKCSVAIDDAIKPHRGPLLKFVEDTVHSSVETTVK